MAEDNEENLEDVYIDEATFPQLKVILENSTTEHEDVAEVKALLQMLAEQVDEDDEVCLAAVENEDVIKMLRGFLTMIIIQNSTANTLEFVGGCLAGMTYEEIIQATNISVASGIPLAQIVKQFHELGEFTSQEEGEELYTASATDDEDLLSVFVDDDPGEIN